LARFARAGSNPTAAWVVSDGSAGLRSARHPDWRCRLRLAVSLRIRPRLASSPFGRRYGSRACRRPVVPNPHQPRSGGAVSFSGWDSFPRWALARFARAGSNPTAAWVVSDGSAGLRSARHPDWRCRLRLAVSLRIRPRLASSPFGRRYGSRAHRRPVVPNPHQPRSGGAVSFSGWDSFPRWALARFACASVRRAAGPSGTTSPEGAQRPKGRDQPASQASRNGAAPPRRSACSVGTPRSRHSPQSELRAVGTSRPAAGSTFTGA
jgi:hypothetical protein